MLAAGEMKVSWPFGAALRGGASSHRMVPSLKTAVLSDAEKAAGIQTWPSSRRFPGYSAA